MFYNAWKTLFHVIPKNKKIKHHINILHLFKGRTQPHQGFLHSVAQALFLKPLR